MICNNNDTVIIIVTFSASSDISLAPFISTDIKRRADALNNASILTLELQKGFGLRQFSASVNSPWWRNIWDRLVCLSVTRSNWEMIMFYRKLISVFKSESLPIELIMISCADFILSKANLNSPLLVKRSPSAYYKYINNNKQLKVGT